MYTYSIVAIVITTTPSLQHQFLKIYLCIASIAELPNNFKLLNNYSNQYDYKFFNLISFIKTLLFKVFIPLTCA